MERKVIPFFLLFLFFGKDISASGQVSISGPECIIPGTEYHYDFYGKWLKEANITVCIEGGFITTDKGTCYKGKGLNSVRVTWKDNLVKGKIAVTSGSEMGSLAVKPTKALYGGNVDSSSRLRSLLSSAAMPVIRCSVVKGGSCSPVYSYQWEQSEDHLHWTEIPGAILQDLSLNKTPGHSVFFRRRILESASNSIAYSNVVMLVILNYQEPINK